MPYYLQMRVEVQASHSAFADKGESKATIFSAWRLARVGGLVSKKCCLTRLTLPGTLAREIRHLLGLFSFVILAFLGSYLL